MRIGRVVVFLVAAGMFAAPMAGQETRNLEGTVNVFMDCNAFGCRDFDFLRREIPVVNWVRNREDADVHILVTSRTTGGGGRAFELSFLGLRDFEGEDMELTWASSGDAVQDEIRTGVSEQIKIGLVRYVVGTPAAERLRVSFGPVAGPGGTGLVGGPGPLPGVVAPLPRTIRGISGCSGSAPTSSASASPASRPATYAAR